jgi:hypothetical protein
MKYLSHYFNGAFDKLINDLEGFYAFSNAQFNEEKKEGVKYARLATGLILPSENVQEYKTRSNAIYENAIKQDMQDHSKEEIIKRELWNYEAFYTGDLEDTISSLKAYGITASEVSSQYQRLLNTPEVQDCF